MERVAVSLLTLGALGAAYLAGLGSRAQPAEPPRAPNSLEVEAYKSFAVLMNTEETTHWTRNNLFQLLHGALAAGFIALLSEAHRGVAACSNIVAGQLKWYPWSLSGLALFGALSSIAWLMMQFRSGYIMDSIFDRLTQIEDAFPDFGIHRRFTVYSQWDRALTGRNVPGPTLPPRWYKRARLSTIWKWLAGSFCIVWTAAIVLVLWNSDQLGAVCVDDSNAATVEALHTP